MSRVHDAMRRLERGKAPERSPEVALSNLVGALLEELADEMPDDPRLETIRTDLLAAAASYATGDKKDLAMRFYLAFRSLQRENALLAEQLRRAEAAKASPPPQYGYVENPPTPHMENAGGQGSYTTPV